MEEHEIEAEWISKFDLDTGRLKENLSQPCYEWVQKNPKRTNEIEFRLHRERLVECYQEIIEFIGEWVDIPDDEKKIIAMWIIGTYFYKHFDAYPYLFLNAMRGSGKTRLLRIISWLQKNGNGQVLNNPSESVVFRTAKERGLVFDEFESEKNRDKQTMREYLNSCYKKDGVVYRMEKQKIDGKEQQVAVGHPLYTPIAMANINGLDEVLLDRSIMLILEKSMNPALVKKIEDFSRNPKVRLIKQKLDKSSCIVCSVEYVQKAMDLWNSFITCKYSTSIHHHHTIHNYTLTIHEDLIKDLRLNELFNKIDSTGIFGRNLELFFPLLILSDLANEVVFDEIIKIVINMNMIKKEDEFAESKDVPLIEFVALADRHRFSYVYTHELFDEFKLFLGNKGTDEESRWLNITWFGLSLKRLKLVSDRKRVAKGQMLLLSIDHAKEKLKIFKTELKEEEGDTRQKPS